MHSKATCFPNRVVQMHSLNSLQGYHCAGFSQTSRNKNCKAPLQVVNTSLKEPMPLTSRPSPYPTQEALRSILNDKLDVEVPVEVPVGHSGQLPTWLKGSYIKNGAGVFPNPDGHLFDGYGLISKVRFEGGKAFFTSRFVDSVSFNSYRATGQLQYREFGTGVDLWRELWNTIKLLSNMGQGVTDNSSVNLVPIPGTNEFWAVTETATGTYRMDTPTLNTIGRLQYSDNIKDPLTTAHGSVFGDYLYNITSDIGKGYTVYRQKLGSSHREVVVKVPLPAGTITPSWVHDFPATANYLVIPETPITFNLVALMGGPAKYVVFDWDPSKATRLHIVRLADGRVTTVQAPKYFTFHYVNCHESDDGASLLIDFPWFDDPAMVCHLLLQEMKNGKETLPNSPIRRLVVPISGDGTVEVQDLSPDVYVELPKVNPKYECRPYRYAYGITATRPCTALANSLGKFDIQSHKTTVWHESGSIPTEPLFIERPGAVEEDDGVVVSHVTGADGKPFLLVLDGPTFQEVARVQIPKSVGYQFHGKFVAEE